MNDERYTKHYVKILNNTLSETILRNVQMQAQAEFVDELVGEIQNENESLKKQVQELGEKLQQVIVEKGDVDNVRYQLQHLETFRNELLKERAEHAISLEKIEELENKITELQSPAKTKIKKSVAKSVLPVEPIEEPVKDGGTF